MKYLSHVIQSLVTVFLLFGIVAFPMQAQTITATLPGITGQLIAVDPMLNKIYVANVDYTTTRTQTVTVIEGNTNFFATLLAGGLENSSNKQGLAVNPVTHKAYLTNNGNNHIIVVDGISNSISSIATVPSCGCYEPDAAVVANPATNNMYIAITDFYYVAALDGVTNNSISISTGVSPWNMAVNPVTNQIYVTNDVSDYVAVIDGVTNNTTNITVGVTPEGIAVNPVTNNVYVANVTSNNITVIDGATNDTTTLPLGASPIAIAANPVTNKIYVVVENGMFVIDGATNFISAIPGVTDATGPMAVNSISNEIYVAGASNITVIDGATYSTSTISGVTGQLAINPVTNQLYVLGATGVTIISGATSISASAVAIQVTINPLANNQTSSSTPNFNFTATNNLTGTSVDNLLYQVDSVQGLWLSASNQGAGVFTGATSPLQPGSHTLYAFATDGEESQRQASLRKAGKSIRL